MGVLDFNSICKKITVPNLQGWQEASRGMEKEREQENRFGLSYCGYHSLDSLTEHCPQIAGVTLLDGGLSNALFDSLATYPNI